MGWLGGNRESEAETQADRAQRPRHENDVAAESRNEDQQGSTSNDLLIYRSSLFLPERNGLIDRQEDSACSAVEPPRTPASCSSDPYGEQAVVDCGDISIPLMVLYPEYRASLLVCGDLGKTCVHEHVSQSPGDPFDKPSCKGCASTLKEPYIKCAECGPPPFLVCLQCFTRGFEYKTHQSDHKYEIMTSDFPVLDPSWTAQEEVGLLEAVMDCGFGNWQDVANQLRTKSKEECESHYMKHFINNPLFSSTLLSLKQMEEARTADTAIPFRPAGDDPPRPTFDSLLSRDMAGYMPARADFMEEFDNYAEWDLRDIDFVADDSDVLHALKIAVVDIYHSRLKERQRRKKIIREHGLISLRKFQSAKVYDRLKRSREEERKKRIMLSEVLQYIQDSNACQQWLHKQAAMSREEERKKRIMLSEVLQYIQDSNACQQWLHKQAAIDAGLNPVVAAISSSAVGRRSAPPLNLTGLPGTDKLNEKEKELCQVVRLVPGAYLEYKAALANECRRQGGLRLAQARALIKIDVNKTRKIYDFLIREGYINKA
ncbi:UNVERIFIED_CONTAM: hypothetical protein FKN15_076190 [Acipenser sinensis]